jgi:hypothetical protein
MYMGIGNYTNLSEIMNSMLEAGRGVSISDMVREAGNRKLILASEGEPADQADLENAFIALADVQYRAGMIALDPENAMEDHLIQLYRSGDLAKKGYGGKEGDSFLRIKWIALADNLPVITNINL